MAYRVARAEQETWLGRRFGLQSDKIFGDVGRVLSENDNPNVMHKFAIAYGRLSMALPYVAYHTVSILSLHALFPIEDCSKKKRTNPFSRLTPPSWPTVLSPSVEPREINSLLVC